VSFEGQLVLVVAGRLICVLVLWRIGYLFKKKGSPRE
jgi:hypothetical protein